MRWDQVCRKFLLGGFIAYRGKLYGVIGLNSMKKTADLQRAGHEDKIFDISAEDLQNEDSIMTKE